MVYIQMLQRNKVSWFIVSNKTAAHGLRVIADHLRLKEEKCVFLIGPDVKQVASFPCFKIVPNWYKLALYLQNVCGGNKAPFNNAFFKRLLSILNRDFIIQRIFFKIFTFRIYFLLSVLNKRKFPQRIYSYGDRHEILETPIITWAVNQKIEVIIPPLAFMADIGQLVDAKHRVSDSSFHIDIEDDFLRRYKGFYQYSKLQRRYISFYPKWMHHYKLTRKLLSTDPWVIGGSKMAKVCVDGDFAKDRLIHENVPKRLILVTGNSEHDVLYAGWRTSASGRKSFLDERGLDYDTRIVVFAVPQYYEHHFCSLDDQRKFYIDFCDQILELDGIYVVISLHPKMDSEYYRRLVRNNKLEVLDRPLREFLPISDLFVSGEGSATALWSVLCQVPYLGLYFYSWRHSGVRNIPFYESVSDLRKVRSVVKYCLESDYGEVFNKKNKFYRRGLSPFDGKCRERIVGK